VAEYFVALWVVFGWDNVVWDEGHRLSLGGCVVRCVVRNALKLLFEMLVGLICALVCAVYWA